MEDTLLAITEAIVRAVAPAQIVLFGSRARGSASPDSDIDLMVIEDAPFGSTRSRRAETARILKALSGFRVPVDVLVYAREEVERWRTAPGHVIERAVREGRTLHARA